MGYNMHDVCDERTSGWDMCSNIQEICSGHPTIHRRVAAIFKSPKLFLRKVDFRFTGENTNLKRVMQNPLQIRILRFLWNSNTRICTLYIAITTAEYF